MPEPKPAPANPARPAAIARPGPPRPASWHAAAPRHTEALVVSWLRSLRRDGLRGL